MQSPHAIPNKPKVENDNKKLEVKDFL